jgi:formylglycine-generating enzyme
MKKVKSTLVPWSLSLICLAILTHGCVKQAAPELHRSMSVVTKSGIEMTLIPTGSFTMGKDGADEDVSPAHQVVISAFAMDRYEVRQKIYEELVLADPSHFKGVGRPVEQVRWMDAVLFCNARSRHEGLEPCYNEVDFKCNFSASGYRLPTEAEWEYACRAGSAGDYCFGNSARELASYASFADNSNKRTARGGSHQANAFGLFDMHGNVSEWVNDVYDPEYYQSSPTENPQGPEQGKERVLRGGAWNSQAAACRSYYRASDTPGTADACFAQDSYGFRCVRNLTPAEKDQLLAANQ